MLSNIEYSHIRNMVRSFMELDKNRGKEIRFEDIDTYIKHVCKLSGLTLDESDYNRLVTDIEYEFKIFHTPGACIFNDYDSHRAWYTDSEKGSQFFWNRYRDYLIRQTKMDIHSINLLDEETLPNIMNCLGNPQEALKGRQLRRGLIIGDVQSGKTATYTGLMCKAADAGYKVVILLAGITESLRRQTQERIDEGIVGLSIIKEGKNTVNKVVGVGIDGQGYKATSFTSVHSDFVGDCDKISMTLDSNKSLVLFVVKKNVTVLTKLYNWLHDMNRDPKEDCILAPMLLIDDEADNASVNTKKDETDPTKTNKIIRKICNLFKNSTYVGFTATPFANVFIDPDSVDAMNNADLFPEHFIYALPTPSNYIGAANIFYEDGPQYRNLRYISDIIEPDYTSEEYRDAVANDIDTLNEGTFYCQHKKEWRGILPDSLKEAVYCFFLANAVRDLRGHSSAPRSMLVNMSRFIKVQHFIQEHIEEIYDDFFSVIRYDFSDIREQNVSLPLYNELALLWVKHFNNITDVSFDRVIEKSTLIAAVEKIKVIVVNGSKNSSKLDYKSNKSLRVIAVGGLALSRGLTLEGLLVSYFYRNTSTFDVLMQMGRWFGYRHGYEDLFQVWTSETSALWYEEISRASEELKMDIKEMFDQQLTPKDFGIKVRYDSKELSITAANKMRGAFDYSVPFTYYGNIFDTPYVSLNTSQNHSNLEAIATLATKLTGAGYSFRFADPERYPQKEIHNAAIGVSRYFADVPKSIVLDFLASLKCSLVNMNFNLEFLSDFISNPINEGIDKWDIVFEGGESNLKYDIPELSMINCVERTICDGNRSIVQISSRRRILGLREGQFALTKEQIAQAEVTCRLQWIADGMSPEIANNRDVPMKAYFQYLPERKPVLIIMLINPKPNNDSTKPENEKIRKFREELNGEKIAAFAIGFPGREEPGNAKRYKVNKIFYQHYMEDAEEEEEMEDKNEE